MFGRESSARVGLFVLVSLLTSWFGHGFAAASDLEALSSPTSGNEQPADQPVAPQPQFLIGSSSETDSPELTILDEKTIENIVSDLLKKKEEVETEKSKQSHFEIGKDLGMTARWHHGLHLESKDKAFRIHPTGRLQVDGAWMNASDELMFGPAGIGNVRDAVAFRRFRVGAEGTFWEIVNFQFEPDLANTVNVQGPGGEQQTITVVVPIDNWVEVTKIPLLGNIRVGSIKPEYEFEHLTSSNNLDFMERSLVFDAFIGGLDNGFQPGIGVYNTFLNERLRLATTFTKNNQTILGFNVGDGEYNTVIRMSGLPIDEDNGRFLVHLGGSYSHKDLDEGRYRFRARTGIRNGPAALQTVMADLTLGASSIDMILPELAVVLGPFSLVAEYAGVWTSSVTRADFVFPRQTQNFPSRSVYFQGFHVEAMYFLTGEHRPYNRRMGFFDRPIPRENFFCMRGLDGLVSGRGAWQVGARFSMVDFNDQHINGGVVQDLALGLNWYLNPNLKFQWNFTMTERDIPGLPSNGTVYGFGTRMAMNF